MVNKKYIGSTIYVSDASRLADTPYIVIPDIWRWVNEYNDW